MAPDCRLNGEYYEIFRRRLLGYVHTGVVTGGMMQQVTYILNDFFESAQQCSGALLSALAIKLEGGFYHEAERYVAMRATASEVEDLATMQGANFAGVSSPS